MARLEVKINSREVQAALLKVPLEIFTEVRRAFKAILRQFEAQFVSTRLTGRPGLNRQSGTLARSFFIRVEGARLDRLRGTFATDSVYAPIHEFGGTIRPTNAKFLAIPLPAVAGGQINSIQRPRDFPDGFFVKTKAGHLLFGISQGQNTFVPLFLLKESVDIPPRMGLLDLWERNRAKNVALIIEACNRAIAKATR